MTSPFDFITRKLHAGMVPGQRHLTRRDFGRLAGGLAATGAITAGELAALEQLAIDLSGDKATGRRTWCEAVAYGQREPLKVQLAHRQHDPDDRPLTWESPIGPGMGEQPPAKSPTFAADYVEPIPAPGADPITDLITYLRALFQPEEYVSYVFSSKQDADGKHKPMGRGTYSRTCSAIIADLERYRATSRTPAAAIECAMSSWHPEAGGWIRVNPVDAQGVGNANVTSCRHVLVESDDLPLDQQLATIHSLNLPCSAIVHSGGKSIHAIVRIDAGEDRALYKERVNTLFARLAEAHFVVDQQCRNPSRLSRIPGLTRGTQVQYLISGPCGAASWEEWDASSRAAEYRADILDPARITAAMPPDNLLGNRFLTRGGSWLLVAQSGIGKSVFATQGAISYAIGRDLFGLAPTAPLRQLIIQAENNALDVQETYQGIVTGLQLSTSEARLLQDNLRIVQADRYTGPEFASFLAWLCQRTQPDIVWIDPLLAYIGGEISRMADCSRFLRNQINPVIHDFNLGVVMVHHTGKPPRGDDKNYTGTDLAYLGIGSSDLTNWARATSTILRLEDCANRYALTHSKRSGRAGCDATTDIMHAPSGICWIPAPGARPTATATSSPGAKRLANSKYAPCGFELMPPLTTHQDFNQSPLHLWITATLTEHGHDTTPALADSVRRTLSRQGFITYDKTAKVWQGVFYDPSFA